MEKWERWKNETESVWWRGVELREEMVTVLVDGGGKNMLLSGVQGNLKFVQTQPLTDMAVQPQDCPGSEQ